MNKSNQRLPWSLEEHISMSFAQGLVVIGMFIKCPVYNELRRPHVKSADDSKWLREAVSHPADHGNDRKSCCSHHHVATSFFFLTERIFNTR